MSNFVKDCNQLIDELEHTSTYREEIVILQNMVIKIRDKYKDKYDPYTPKPFGLHGVTIRKDGDK